MSLTAFNIIEILKNLIGGNEVDTPLGKGLTVNSREAFLFCSIAGGAYFENQIFPFTPKGLLKVFYNANDFNLVTGLFDNVHLKNTPYYISEHRTYIKSDSKTIVPIDINSENELRSILKSAYPNNTNDPDLILFKVDISKKGNGLEPFMEYLACKYFTSEGYITENQIPLSHRLGSPDFGGFKLNKLQDIVYKSGMLNRGFNILELAMLRSFPITKKISSTTSDNYLLVGEAKTSTTSMNAQLIKYINSGYFNSAVEIHPTKPSPSRPEYALLNLHKNRIFFNKPITRVDFSNSNQKNYINWLESYFNCYLIANYTNDELSLISEKLIDKPISSKLDIIDLIKNVSFAEHFNNLSEFLNHGIIK